MANISDTVYVLPLIDTFYGRVANSKNLLAHGVEPEPPMRAMDYHVDVDGIELELCRTAVDTLSGDRPGATAAEWVEEEVAMVRAVPDCVGG